MTRLRWLVVLLASAAAVPCLGQGAGEKSAGGLTVDKDKRLIKIDAKVAPRKLPNLKDIYPIEVIACWPHPKGKKAHETVVTIDAHPSAVHKALESLGLKPGKPVLGESKDPPQGPEVNLYIEVDGPDGVKRLTMDKVLVDKRNGKPFPKSIKFRFTGSAMIAPDPEKDDKVYGADISGTLIAIFPVTDQTTFQTNKTIEDEKYLKLETNPKYLPKEGTPVKLVIEVPAGK
jgi:hypothetical protein